MQLTLRSVEKCVHLTPQQRAKRQEKNKKMPKPHFRFEDLEVWQLAKELAIALHKVADNLERKNLYRYAEQLRGAGISLTNNIAEGSGSIHDKEFYQFLNIARRSLFEDASMLLLFEAMHLIDEETTSKLLCDCENLSRKIICLMKSTNK